MAKQKKQKPTTTSLAEVVAMVRGKALIYADNSWEFHPNKESGEPLYTGTVAETKAGSVKNSGKSLVARVMISSDSTDPKAELLKKMEELVNKIPSEGRDPVEVAEKTEFVGSSSHAKVFLQKNNALVQVVVPFDEENPTLANILKYATPQQLKSINRYQEPEVILQQEYADIVILVRKAFDLQKKLLTNKKNK